MVQAADWKDCGQPATHLHRGSRMVFCERHALASNVLRLDMVKLSPNVENKANLSECLLNLAAWATARANGEHDTRTTLSILRRKTDRIHETEPTDKPQPPQDVFVAKDLLGCGGKTAIKPYKELKPCPFCFGQACLHRRRSVNNAVGNAKTGWVYHVHCIGCGAHFHEDGNEPSAISRWNTGDR